MARKVIIVGAGASGLIAAIAAARVGAEVTVLDAMDRPGRKLLLTGNGRCNLTNMDSELPMRYYGSGQKLAQSVTERFGAKQTRRFFEELGLLTIEKNGYVYPYNMQSSAVLDVLLAELRRLKVKLKLNEKVETIEIIDSGTENEKVEHVQAGGSEVRPSDRWRVKTSSWSYQADALILACGSRCLPKTGSDGSGYRLAAQLGHRIIEPGPALTALNCSGDFFASLAGVRCRARVTLLEDGRSVKEEIGELQWTKYGVSGIVIFQLSRFVSAGTPGRYAISVDLLSDFERIRLTELLSVRAQALEHEPVTVLLKGILHEKLIPVVLAKAGVRKAQLCTELEEAETEKIVSVMKAFPLQTADVRSFDECQVCSGGVDCGEVNEETLESRLHPDLYFAGELLDVDGPCGGYNLQWAWASGYIAGQAAGRIHRFHERACRT